MAATIVTFDGVKITLESVDSPAEIAETVKPLGLDFDNHVLGKKVVSAQTVNADGERPNAYMVYTLEDGFKVCTCPDAIIRENIYCKHLRRLHLDSFR